MTSFPRFANLFAKRPSDLPEPLDFPPPFHRMLAINSDVEFTTWEAQVDLIRLFAERGLETAFSYWFFADPLTTWRIFELDGAPSTHAEAAWVLARAGVLDTLHSFGGAANGGGVHFRRAQIARAFDRMHDAEITTSVYSNHGTTKDIQNIGGYWCEPRIGPITSGNYQEGDLIHSDAYHVDLTMKHGLKFFWLDTDRIRDEGWFNIRPSKNGSRLFHSQICRDGTAILRFRRTDCGFEPHPPFFGRQIEYLLDEDSSGYCVLYTHLGFARQPDGSPGQNRWPYLRSDGLAALDRLAASQEAGQTLVTTTTRLLRFALLMAARPWSTRRSGLRITVDFQEAFSYLGIPFQLGWRDLDGFTLPVSPSDQVSARLGTQERRLAHWRAGAQHYAGFPWGRISVLGALEEALGRVAH